MSTPSYYGLYGLPSERGLDLPGARQPGGSLLRRVTKTPVKPPGTALVPVGPPPSPPPTALVPRTPFRPQPTTQMVTQPGPWGSGPNYRPNWVPGTGKLPWLTQARNYIGKVAAPATAAVAAGSVWSDVLRQVTKYWDELREAQGREKQDKGREGYRYPGVGALAAPGSEYGYPAQPIPAATPTPTLGPIARANVPSVISGTSIPGSPNQDGTKDVDEQAFMYEQARRGIPYGQAKGNLRLAQAEREGRARLNADMDSEDRARAAWNQPVTNYSPETQAAFDANYTVPHDRLSATMQRFATPSQFNPDGSRTMASMPSEPVGTSFGYTRMAGPNMSYPAAAQAGYQAAHDARMAQEQQNETARQTMLEAEELRKLSGSAPRFGHPLGTLPSFQQNMASRGNVQGRDGFDMADTYMGGAKASRDAALAGDARLAAVSWPGAWDARPVSPGESIAAESRPRARSTTEMLRGAAPGEVGRGYVSNPGGRNTIVPALFSQHMQREKDKATAGLLPWDARRAMVTGRASGAPITQEQAMFMTSPEGKTPFGRLVAAVGPEGASRVLPFSPEYLAAMQNIEQYKAQAKQNELWGNLYGRLVEKGATPKEIKRAREQFDGDAEAKGGDIPRDTTGYEPDITKTDVGDLINEAYRAFPNDPARARQWLVSQGVTDIDTEAYSEGQESGLFGRMFGRRPEDRNIVNQVWGVLPWIHETPSKTQRRRKYEDWLRQVLQQGTGQR